LDVPSSRIHLGGEKRVFDSKPSQPQSRGTFSSLTSLYTLHLSATMVATSRTIKNPFRCQDLLPLPLSSLSSSPGEISSQALRFVPLSLARGYKIRSLPLISFFPSHHFSLSLSLSTLPTLDNLLSLSSLQLLSITTTSKQARTSNGLFNLDLTPRSHSSRFRLSYSLYSFDYYSRG